MDTPSVRVAKKYLEHEMSLIEDNPPEPEDKRIVSAYYYEKTYETRGQVPPRPSDENYQARMAAQMHALRWRFRIQEPFWLALEALENNNLIEPDLLQAAVITWDTKSEEIFEIAGILDGFEVIQQCLDLGAEVDVEGSFDSPVYWLANIIYHCSRDVNKTLAFLFKRQILGDVTFDEPHIVSEVG